MRICFVANADSVHVQRWIKYFVDRGHDVNLITHSDKVLGGATTHRATSIGIPNYISGLIKTSKFIKEIKPDIVHAHYVSRYGVYAALANFHPLVITAWGSDVLIEPKKFGILRPMIKLALEKADMLTCDGENTTKKAIIKLGANPQKIRIVYFGVDTKKFRPRKKDKNLLKNLSITDSQIVISLRYFKPVYNIETLIKSMLLILKHTPNVKFIIAGKGPEEDSLKKLAKSLGILNSARFVGWIPNDRLPRYLASSDIYVSTSLSDSGLAVSTAEAMACELPVVITDIGDNRRWVEDGKNGFIVPVKDSKSLAKKIIYLLENEDVRTRLGKASRKIIEEKLNYRKEMEKMEKLYEGLVKG